jgi:DNA-binding SARP family transcriptional activator
VVDGHEWWLRLVGPVAVAPRERPAAVHPVGSRKARTVLAALAVEHGRPVPADRLVDALWPEALPQRPADNLATLISRLRATLGADTIIGGRAGYRLGPRLRIDLYEAAALIADAETRLAADEPTLALVAGQRAGELLGCGVGLGGGGSLITDLPEAAWAEPARSWHRELVRRARHVVAGAALRTGELAVARTAAETALAADAFDEAACRVLMRAHAAAGEPARALATYARLQEVLTEELGADPAPATRDLHLAILRNPPATVGARPPRGDRCRDRPAGDPGFVGRDAELARLAAAWSGVAGGGCRLVLISGEAGIGKTGLADQVTRLATGTGGLVAAALCYQIERSLPLRPVVEALSGPVAELPAEVLREAAADRAGTLAWLLPELASVLGPAPPEPGRLREAVAGFLRRLSARRPVLLVLDDLHHADPGTGQLLHYLARQPAGIRLLVVATVRAEAGDAVPAALAGVAERLELGPLDRGAIATLAAAAGLPELAGAVERRTRGHTRSVVEMLRARAAGEPGIPDSLRAAVLERVRYAGPQAEELLRAAAVLGPGFHPAGLAGLLEISGPEAARRCERALSARLAAVAGPGYEFANDLIRQVLYETTPPPTRVAYRQLTADANRSGIPARLS